MQLGDRLLTAFRNSTGTLMTRVRPCFARVGNDDVETVATSSVVSSMSSTAMMHRADMILPSKPPRMIVRLAATPRKPARPIVDKTGLVARARRVALELVTQVHRAP